MKQLIIGNQAVACGALAAGVDVVAGYPGTPSSEALTELLHFAQGTRPAPPKADQPAGQEGVPAVKHPITFCAGCPHRGTYMALNRAIKKAGLEKERIVVTGDIGCTILGMNPPFHSCWTEVSMGSSIGLAQGFLRAGMPAPVVPTIGDSTFFHAGSRLAPRGT